MLKYMILNNDILEYIFTLIINENNFNLFNIHKKCVNILIVNKNFYSILINIINNKCYILKKQLINNNLPKYIIDIFQNKDTIYNLPIIKFKNSFIGYTDCIDNIKVSDIDRKIMMGIDYFKRPFFTFKIKYYNFNKKFIKTKISVLYQRYINNTQHWVFESYYNNNFNNIMFQENNFIKLKEIIQNNKIKYKNYLIYI